jgi:prepilin-type processing-associated H-X9-DG protein
MSQFPPPPPPQDFVAPNPHSGAPPKTSGLAVNALVLGIVGLLCSPVGVVGLVLGIVAISQINKDPRALAGKGLAIAGIVTGALSTVIMIVALPIAILLPSLGKARELSQRSTCAANLRGIAQSMILYANDNQDTYPYLGPKNLDARSPVGDTPGGLMHDMFYLVGSGAVAPKQFLCKSDPAGVTPSLTPTQTPAHPGYTPTYWTNTTGADPNLTYSYSFAFQYASKDSSVFLGAWWRNTMDAGAPIGADMNPGTQLGYRRSMFNSLTHQSDGQNIAFADGHAEFSRTPCAGENGDHIYNVGVVNNPTAPGLTGIPPFASASGNMPGTFDTCLVPGIADTTTFRRQ